MPSEYEGHILPLRAQIAVFCTLLPVKDLLSSSIRKYVDALAVLPPVGQAIEQVGSSGAISQLALLPSDDNISRQIATHDLSIGHWW